MESVGDLVDVGPGLPVGNGDANPFQASEAIVSTSARGNASPGGLTAAGRRPTRDA